MLLDATQKGAPGIRQKLMSGAYWNNVYTMAECSALRIAKRTNTKRIACWAPLYVCRSSNPCTHPCNRQSQLHTLEDFAAHSNFCELTLVSMGYQDVYTHVGDRVRIPVRGNQRKMVAPLITGDSYCCRQPLSVLKRHASIGTFGSSDFIHSLLGEATDHIVRA
jgi:hypothetical protein